MEQLRVMYTSWTRVWSALWRTTSRVLCSREIMLEKVVASARRAVKLAEPYKPYGGRAPGGRLLIFEPLARQVAWTLG